MINNSFLLPAGQQWLKDGQAIVATTEDEGLWFSFDYGETWANVDLGVTADKAVIAHEPSMIPFGHATIYAANGNQLYQYRIQNAAVTVKMFTESITHLKSSGLGMCWVATGTPSTVNYLYQMYSQTPSPTTSSDIGLENGLYTRFIYFEPYFGSYNIGETAYITGLPAYFRNKGIRLNGVQVNYPAQPYGWPGVAYMGNDQILFGDDVAYLFDYNTGIWTPHSTDFRFDVLFGGSPNYDFEGRFIHGYPSNGNPGMTGLVVAWRLGERQVLRFTSNDYLDFQPVYASNNVRDVSMSHEGRIQAIAVYDTGLLVSSNYGSSFDTKLVGKKITSVSVTRLYLNKIKKPKI